MNPETRHRNLYEDPLAVLIWWYDLAIFALMFPSNSVIVFLRKNLGYRLMRPWVFWIVFGFLMFWTFTGAATNALFSGQPSGGMTRPGRNPYRNGFPGAVAPDAAPPEEAPSGPSNAPYIALGSFAVLMGLLAYYHRKMGWELVFRNPGAVHSMGRGDSHLQRLVGRLPAVVIPTPKPLLRLPLIKPRYHFLPVPEWITQRYIEPALVGLLGIALMFGPHWTTLGMWLFVSGVALAGIEALVIEKAVNALLDVRDDRVEAKMLSDMDKMITDKGEGKPTDETAKSGGLVTASPELMRLRAARLAAQPVETHAVVNEPETKQTPRV